MQLSLRTRGHKRNGNEHVFDRIYSPTLGTSLWEVAPMQAALADPGTFMLFRDDFLSVNNVATTGLWKIVKDGSVSQTILDAHGGWVNIVTDVNDNDEVYMATQGESYLFAASKPVWFEAKVKLTEANTDDANIIVGMMDAAGANSLLDNGAGPAASYSGAVWCKVDGGTVWQFETSNAGTQVTTASAGAFASGTEYRLGFVFDPGAGTTGTITPYLNGVEGTAHSITLASLTEMRLVLGVKAGGGNAETLKVDYVQALAVR